MQIWAESGKSALPICNYSQILYQFLTFTQNLKRSRVRRLLFSSFKLLSWIIASSTYNRGLTLIAIVINASTLMIKTKMIHIRPKMRIFLWTFSSPHIFTIFYVPWV